MNKNLINLKKNGSRDKYSYSDRKQKRISTNVIHFSLLGYFKSRSRRAYKPRNSLSLSDTTFFGFLRIVMLLFYFSVCVWRRQQTNLKWRALQFFCTHLFHLRNYILMCIQRPSGHPKWLVNLSLIVAPTLRGFTKEFLMTIYRTDHAYMS